MELSDEFDLLVIATAHDCYRSIDLKALRVSVVDTRHLVQDSFDRLYRT